MINNLTVHMVVQNEEQWIWYGIQSVINWVYKIIIYDTGSTDNTIDIIKSIKSDKISFTKYDNVNYTKLVDLRNKQIQQTTTPWFMILDGDEVWPEITIKELITVIENKSDNLYGIVVPVTMPVGDLYHYQSGSAGKYNLSGRIGHYNLRGYRKLPYYRWKGVYPLEAYVNQDGIPIQKSNKLQLLKNSYWHMSLLKRSRIDHGKVKYEIGEKTDYILPKVFYHKRPDIVASPWIKYQWWETILALCLTPLYKIKRFLIK